MSEALRLDPVRLTQELVRIPSVKTEAGVIRRINQAVAETFPSSFKVKRIPTGVRGRASLIIANSETPDFWAMGHMDTVSLWKIKEHGELGEGIRDPLGGEIIEGKLFGRGAGDDKGGIAVAMAAVAQLGEMAPKVGLILTADEEHGLTGAKTVETYLRKLLFSNPGYKPGFVLSMNGNDGEMSVGCRGDLELDVEFIGKTGHAAIKKADTPPTYNAIRGGVAAIDDLEILLNNLPETALGRTTVNLGDIVGGTLDEKGEITHAWNTVPDYARMQLEFRLNSGIFEEMLLNATTITALLRDFAGLRDLRLGEVIKGTDVAAWTARREDVNWLENIVKEVTGVTDINFWKPGEHGFDEIAFIMRAFNGDRVGPQVPSALLGFCPSKGFHQPDEYLGVEDMLKWTEITMRAMSDEQFKRTEVHI